MDPFASFGPAPGGVSAPASVAAEAGVPVPASVPAAAVPVSGPPFNPLASFPRAPFDNTPIPGTTPFEMVATVEEASAREKAGALYVRGMEDAPVSKRRQGEIDAGFTYQLAKRAATVNAGSLAFFAATATQQAAQQCIFEMFRAPDLASTGMVPALSIRCQSHTVAPLPGDKSVTDAAAGFSVIVGVMLKKRRTASAPPPPVLPPLVPPRYDADGRTLLNPEDESMGTAAEDAAERAARALNPEAITLADSTQAFVVAAASLSSMADTLKSTIQSGSQDGMVPSVSTRITGWTVAPDFIDGSKATTQAGFTIVFTVLYVRPIETPSASAAALSETAYKQFGGLPLNAKAARLESQRDVDNSVIILPPFAAPNTVARPAYVDFAQVPSSTSSFPTPTDPSAAAASVSASASAFTGISDSDADAEL